MKKISMFAAGLFCISSALNFEVLAANLNELLPTERNNIEIFQKFSPKVVYVHRLSRQDRYQQSISLKKMGAGSGIIWDNKGHIVTNYHVIKNAANLAISFGKLTVAAKVIGAEPRKDIAVLVVNSAKALELLRDYQSFEMVPSRDLLVGQKVLAIGNPFGLDHSLTTGVISALGRQVPGIGGVTIHEMIQTDASINPGNSGGPLLDSKGRLIGMNTAIYSDTGSSAGVGFAVAADDLERIVPQIIQHGRPILAGIGISRMDEGMAAHLGVDKGILIAETLPKTPAREAGLRGTYRDTRGAIHIGDIIVALNDKTVNDYDDLYNILSGLKVQETIKLTVIRHGKPLDFNMKTIDIAGY